MLMKKVPTIQPENSHSRRLNKSRDLFISLTILTIMVVYLIVSTQIQRLIGDGVFALMVFFPAAAGWFLGMRGGLTFGLLNMFFLYNICHSVGLSDHELIFTGIPAGVTMTLVAVGVGRLHDLTVHIRKEVHQRKAAEEALQEANISLERRVNERTAELESLNQKLKQEIMEHHHTEEERKRLEIHLMRAQKMEALGTLAGGVAHDLNNILSGIVSYPELLLMDIPQDSPLRKPIMTIQKSGEKAAAIVQDLLTLARRGVAVTEVVNLNDIVSDYMKSPEYEKLMFYHSTVQVKTILHKGLLNMIGSPVHITKTVMNLISNAAEAMPEGGTITITTENRYVDQPINGYAAIEEGDYVILRVSDDGVGIPAQDIEMIFEPFYTKKMMGRSGTGLGMAVVWGTVKDHRGYVDVQSKEGEGTEIILYFPLARSDSVRESTRLSMEDYMGRGESILVVDDVEEQRIIATVILEKLGYSVTAVASGEEAIEYMMARSADLLVLDMIMDPGIDGLETYKRILQFQPGQRAIIASGFAESERVKEAQELGARTYVKKPYMIEKIGLAVRMELDQER